VLLSTADLCPDVRPLQRAVRERAPGVPVLAVSSLRGEGVDEVRKLLTPGTTAVVLGSSGVGKSTLINTLLGEERLPVTEVRQRDRRGRHTTVQRCLVALPDGGLIIDTLGLRELVPWQGDEGLGRAFADIEELAA